MLPVTYRQFVAPKEKYETMIQKSYESELYDTPLFRWSIGLKFSSQVTQEKNRNFSKMTFVRYMVIHHSKPLSLLGKCHDVGRSGTSSIPPPSVPSHPPRYQSDEAAGYSILHSGAKRSKQQMLPVIYKLCVSRKVRNRNTKKMIRNGKVRSAPYSIAHLA